MAGTILVRRLSSGATPIFKFVLPPVIAIALLALFWASLSESFGAALFFVPIAALIGFQVHQYLLPLKSVVATAHGLLIGNYRMSITVPYTELAAVARAYKRWDLVEIGFQSETPFGRAIVFMAGARFFWSSEHPVVAFLRHRAGLESTG